MEIKIFKGLSVEDHLKQIEENADCYDLSEIKMSNADDRKFVKAQASEITDIIKKINTKRIAVKKEYGLGVEKEAKYIIDRLSGAASEFTNLIEAFNAERKVILDAEKDRKQAILDAEQKIIDESDAYIEGKARAFDKVERERLQKERDDQLIADTKRNAEIAAEQAEVRRVNDIEQEKQRVINLQLTKERDIEIERQTREQDETHRKTINLNVINALIAECGIDRATAIKVVAAAMNKKLNNLIINY